MAVTLLVQQRLGSVMVEGSTCEAQLLECHCSMGRELLDVVVHGQGAVGRIV